LFNDLLHTSSHNVARTDDIDASPSFMVIIHSGAPENWEFEKNDDVGEEITVT